MREKAGRFHVIISNRWNVYFLRDEPMKLEAASRRERAIWFDRFRSTAFEPLTGAIVIRSRRCSAKVPLFCQIQMIFIFPFPFFPLSSIVSISARFLAGFSSPVRSLAKRYLCSGQSWFRLRPCYANEFDQFTQSESHQCLRIYKTHLCSRTQRHGHSTVADQ